MPDPVLWCEARCYCGLGDLIESRAGLARCHESAPGALGSRAGAMTARAYGWRVVRGEWACPACYEAALAAAASKGTG